MKNIKDGLNRSKEFVKRHKVAVAIVGTAVVGLMLNRAALREHDAFLEEKGLLDEFYSPDEE